MEISKLSVNEQNLIKVSVALCIVAFLNWGAFLIAPLVLQPKPLKSGMRWANPPSSERLQAVLEHTRQLREKMHPWAFRHQDTLKQLQSGDPKVFQEIYDAIPMYPDEKVIGIKPDDTLDYIWQHHVNGSNTHIPASLSPVESSRQQDATHFESFLKNYHREKYKDVMVTQSTMVGGPMEYTLWASGRITETNNPLGVRGMEERVRGSREREIVPAFDFVAGK